MNEYNEIQELLHKMNDHKIPYAVFGSFGYWLHCKQIKQYWQISDIDVLLPNTIECVHEVIRLLWKYNAQVQLWEEPLYDLPSTQKLKGKYYFRAMLSGVRIDFTYEHSYKMEIDHYVLQECGIRVLSLSAIVLIKKTLNRKQDQDFITCLIANNLPLQ